MPETLVDILVASGAWPEDEARAAAPRLRRAARSTMHGTVEARDRHLARGEPLCDRCRAHGVPRSQVAHGTARGARWHRAHGEDLCGPCRRAWADYIAAWRAARAS